MLGGGRHLSPQAAQVPQAASPAPAHARNASLLSPSESSVSLSSHTSQSHDDINTNVLLGPGDTTAAAAAASSRLVCPICSEEMVRLARCAALHHGPPC
jgi:rabenosyn-5